MFMEKIIRARPKYLRELFSENIKITKYTPKENEFYFTSGRAALKFLFTCIKQVSKKTPVVAMQAFNCEVVANAAIEAGCKIVLLDIKLNDFSICFDDIYKLSSEIDVLVITHYQGIPNSEYLKINKYCQESSIITVDDLAQTFGSKIYGVEVGKASNFCVESYSFDKPFSCLRGGKLLVNQPPPLFLKYINNKYSGLMVESSFASKNDIKVLQYMYKYTSKKHYGVAGLYTELLIILKYMGIPNKKINSAFKLLRRIHMDKILGVLNSVLSKLRSHKIKIIKMSQYKIDFIEYQRELYCYNPTLLTGVHRVMRELNIDVPKHEGQDIHWNRYSVLDDTGKLSKKLFNENLEAGNYNWPVTLDKIFENNVNVNVNCKLLNSKYASKYVVNIPVWTSF